jgi:beta-glucosidase
MVAQGRAAPPQGLRRAPCVRHLAAMYPHGPVPIRARARPRGGWLWGLLALCGNVAAAPAPLQLAHWPAAHPPLEIPPQVSELVTQLLATMSPEEKVGQVLQADLRYVTPEDLGRYHLGALLAAGGAGPEATERVSAARWLEVTAAYRAAARAAATPAHVPIPLLIGIDAVHGNARIHGATVFPHNIGLGATHDPQLLEQVGRVTAAEVAAIGMNWAFAPTVAVARDARWGRTYESFSEDPQRVAASAAALIRGLQGRAGTPDFLAPGRVLATAKHFLGDGGTQAGRDQFDDPADEITLAQVHAAGYVAAIDAGVLSVMASYSAWQGVKMHVNSELLHGVLKQHWQFPGFVVSDWNAHEQIPGCSRFDCPQLLHAGIDLYMAPDGWRRLYDNLLRELREGSLDAAALDAAVRRILTVKALAHLFDPSSADATRTLLDSLGSADHRALARAAVRASLVLLKNDRQLLPLNPHATILVAGTAADDIADQCGGWTIDWQGDHNRNYDFPGATSIFAGIRAAVAAAGGQALLSPDGAFDQRPAAAIVVFGERPYAEYQGDRNDLNFGRVDRRHLELLRRLHAARVPIVSVFLSGRPLWINPELNLSDALVAAWLPGSEGAGVADLLFKSGGAHHYDFSGRLGFSWPASAQPVRFAADGSVVGAQFARGYGLSLAARRTLARLPENPHAPRAERARRTLFAAGQVTPPWSLFAEDAEGSVRATLATQSSPQQVLTATLAPQYLEARWTGVQRAVLAISGRAQDYRTATQSNAALVLRYQLLERPSRPVLIGMRCEPPYGLTAREAGSRDWRLCGSAYGASVDLLPLLSRTALDSWRTLVVPLRCLAANGADLGNVGAPLTLDTAGKLQLRIREVALATRVAACPPAANHT